MYIKLFKRLIDILLALIMLLPIIFISIFISIAIVIEDHSPIFYSALRIGQNGRLFKMHKFRSMKVNAPDIRLDDGSTFNDKNDPRVTKVGKFIREASLDELPQVINVLMGDMSFIGPRPDPPDWLERYPEEFKSFLKVKPGITGYSQAYFRNSADGYEKMVNDLHYANNVTFWFDVKIFFMTFFSVLKKENMYKINKKNENKNDQV